MLGARSREVQSPSNDAHLVQLVRGALGRTEWTGKGLSRINVSSCKLVVTLHGVVPDFEARGGIETAVREVPGVLDVIDKLSILEDDRAWVFPTAECGVSRSQSIQSTRTNGGVNVRQ